MSYRPTTLRLASAHCPRAIDYYETKRARFHEVFQEGIAAHECLASVGIWALAEKEQPSAGEIVRICERVTEALITTGRRFDDQPEPPMVAEAAFAGRDLAIQYATAEGTTWLTEDCWIERGLAFDASWRPVPYGSPAARFQLIPDRMALIDDGDEEYSGRLLLVSDYKSSWQTDAEELQTVQMKMQALAGYLLYGHQIDGIRREVINLRTGQRFAEDIWLESGGRDQICGWRADVEKCMTALDRMRDPQTGLRPLRPGAGCLSCPWAINCEAPHPMAREVPAMAQRLAQIDGERDALIGALKLALPASPVRVDGGEVGWGKQEKRQPRSEAAQLAWQEWQAKQGDMAGFLVALGASMGGLHRVAKQMAKRTGEPTPEVVEGFLGQWTEIKVGREFGVRRTQEGA